MSVVRALPRASSTRLTRDDWVEAAAKMLAREGVEGVRVEKVAKVLGVTKGSFYWHFKDRDELCDAVLEAWRKQNTIAIIEFVGNRETALSRLQYLVRMPFAVDVENDDPMRMALSLRLWARHDERVLKVLNEVDDLRTRMMSQLLMACGFDAAEAEARSVLLSAYMRVAVTIIEPGNEDLRRRCEELLLPITE